MAAGAEAGSAELPSGAPRWLKVVQYLLSLTIFTCFAAIGSWIALSGPRAFTGTLPLGSVVGRIVFGIGSAVVWIALIAIAIPLRVGCCGGARPVLSRAPLRNAAY